MSIKTFIMDKPFTELDPVLLSPTKNGVKEVMLWRFKDSSETFQALIKNIYTCPLKWYSDDKKGGTMILRRLDNTITPIEISQFWCGGGFTGTVRYSSNLGALLEEYEIKALMWICIELLHLQSDEQKCYIQKEIQESTEETK